MEGSRRYRCGSVMDLLGNEKSEELGGSIFRIFRPFCVCVCVSVCVWRGGRGAQFDRHLPLKPDEETSEKKLVWVLVSCFTQQNSVKPSRTQQNPVKPRKTQKNPLKPSKTQENPLKPIET